MHLEGKEMGSAPEAIVTIITACSSMLPSGGFFFLGYTNE